MTFDLVEVRDFVASLDARMDRCLNGEGMECATLEAALRHHAALCREFSERVREWGRQIFAGHVAFDPEVERMWISEGWRLHDRATDMHWRGQASGEPCYILEGQDALLPALWDLYRLLKGWVTPKLSVGPAARQGLPLDSAAAEQACRRRRIAAAIARGLATG